MRELIALTRRRVPDVAFLDDLFGDSGSSTVTITTPGGGSSGTATRPTFVPPAPPEFSFEAPQFAPLPQFQMPTVVEDPAIAAMRAHAIAAMNGTLPIPAELTGDLDRQEAQLHQAYARQGAGYETSTPFMQALTEFKSRRTQAEDAARHGANTQGLTNNILQGLIRSNEAQQQSALAVQKMNMEAALADRQSQAQMAMAEARFGEEAAMADYQARLEAAKLDYQAQVGAQGTTQTVNKTGGPSPYGTAIASIGGLGLAAIASGSKKPWWMGGEDPSAPAATRTGAGAPGGSAGFSLTPPTDQPRGTFGVSPGSVLAPSGLDFSGEPQSPFGSFSTPGLDLSSTAWDSAGINLGGWDIGNYDLGWGDPGGLDLTGAAWDPGSWDMSANAFDLGGFDLGGWNTDFSGFDWNWDMPAFDFNYDFGNFGDFGSIGDFGNFDLGFDFSGFDLGSWG